MAAAVGLIRSGASLTRVMNCASTLASGDLVYQSLTIDNHAVKATDNNTTKPVVGLVVGKPTSTTALVLFMGVTSYTVNRGKIYVSETGTVTNAAPTTGHLHPIGESFGDGKIFFKPDNFRIKRS